MANKIDQSDEYILNLLAANDSTALAILFKAHYKAVYNNVKKVVKDEDNAKDIVQELFIAVWEKRSTLKITKPIRRYLFSAAYNRALNFRRDLARKNRLLEMVFKGTTQIPAAPSMQEDLEGKELQSLIKTSISLLPKKIKITFFMSRSLGMTYKEIAAHLRVSEKAVEKNMSKALRMLRKIMSHYL